MVLEERGIRRFLNMLIQLHQLQKESCRYIRGGPPTRIVNLQYLLVFLVLPAKCDNCDASKRIA
jgi:hypothetical protein